MPPSWISMIGLASRTSRTCPGIEQIVIVSHDGPPIEQVDVGMSHVEFAGELDLLVAEAGQPTVTCRVLSARSASSGAPGTRVSSAPIQRFAFAATRGDPAGGIAPIRTAATWYQA